MKSLRGKKNIETLKNVIQIALRKRGECKLLHSTESANLLFSNVFMVSTTLVGSFLSS